MKELFIITDYDTGKPMLYFLTDNAEKCDEILYEVDIREDKDDWLSLFTEECEKQGVKLEYFENTIVYEY